MTFDSCTFVINSYKLPGQTADGFSSDLHYPFLWPTPVDRDNGDEWYFASRVKSTLITVPHLYTTRVCVCVRVDCLMSLLAYVPNIMPRTSLNFWWEPRLWILNAKRAGNFLFMSSKSCCSHPKMKNSSSRVPIFRPNILTVLRGKNNCTTTSVVCTRQTRVSQSVTKAIQIINIRFCPLERD